MRSHMKETSKFKWYNMMMNGKNKKSSNTTSFIQFPFKKNHQERSSTCCEWQIQHLDLHHGSSSATLLGDQRGLQGTDASWSRSKTAGACGWLSMFFFLCNFLFTFLDYFEFVFGKWWKMKNNFCYLAIKNKRCHRNLEFLWLGGHNRKSDHTVDGRNPAPIDR